MFYPTQTYCDIYNCHWNDTSVCKAGRLPCLTNMIDSKKTMQEELARLKTRFTAPIVCLCGSTRFWRTFQWASLQETMAGRIVLSIGAASGTDDEHFGNLAREEYDRVKTMLDDLYKRKIDLCDWILVLDVGGYIGESTRSEIEYAEKIGRPVRYLSKEFPGYVEPVDEHLEEGDTRADAAGKCLVWVVRREKLR